MSRQPWGDTTWQEVLAHRGIDQRAAVADRFERSGVGPSELAAVLADLGLGLCVAASAGEEGWARSFGGALAVALLSAEVSAFTASLNSRASAVRARAVEALLDEFSAVTVAERLGISRQKVYEIGHATALPPCPDRPGGGHG